MHKINQSTKGTKLSSALQHCCQLNYPLYFELDGTLSPLRRFSRLLYVQDNNICYVTNNYFTTKVCILESISQDFNMVVDSEIIDLQK